MKRLNLNTNLIAVDTETTGLNPWRQKSRWGIYPDRPFAFSFCDSDGNTDYVRWNVDPTNRQVIIDKSSQKQMALILKDPSITKVFHNINFDYRMLSKVGLKPEGKFHDTIFLAHIVSGGSEISYKLKDLGEKYLDITKEDQDALIKSVHKGRRLGKKNKWAIAQKETHGDKPVYADYWLGDKELCKEYAVKDAERTMLLYLSLIDDLTPKLSKVYSRELNLSKVIRRMENKGCRVFPDEIKSLRKFYQDYMNKQMAIINKNGGKGLNFNSSKQMQHKFYEELGYKPAFNKDGNRTLDAKALLNLSKESKLAKAILEWKAGDHMQSSFLDPYEKFMVKESKGVYVLHPNFRQVGPVTGRMSCTDPNLMNVASEKTGDKKTEIGLKPRQCLGPRPGHIWLMPDWSQIEVWLFSFLSKDETMMNALLKGKDFHAENATKVWGLKKDFKANPGIYRKRAKNLFFSLLYGGGAKTVSKSLNCSYDEAMDFIDNFKDELPGIQKFTDKLSDEIYDNGYIQNPLGRKYVISNSQAYKAVNYMIQGTAADIAKRSMIRLDRLFRKYYGSVNLILMLHDEFAIEVPNKNNYTTSVRWDVVKAMQVDHKKVGVPVPFPVDMDIVTKRWSESKELCRKHLILCEDCK